MNLGNYSKALAPLLAGTEGVIQAYETHQDWRTPLINTVVAALLVWLVPNVASAAHSSAPTQPQSAPAVPAPDVLLCSSQPDPPVPSPLPQPESPNVQHESA